MKKVFYKDVAFKEYTVTTENLPYPIVLYPGHYGTFFAFKCSQDSDPFFCSCAYEAIENYIKLRAISHIPRNSSPSRMYILGSGDFPKSVVEPLMQTNVSQKNVLSSLNFADKLCHECNLQTPSYRYCHEMYGGVFKQNYGWYITKQSFEWGIAPLNYRKQFLLECCPDEILTIINEPEFESTKRNLSLMEKRLSATSKLYYSEDPIEISEMKKNINANKVLYKEQEIYRKAFGRYRKKIQNIIENEVRRKFGHKDIGEAWTSETILYYIIKKLFPQYTIYRHYRPRFLQGLELDIFIEGLNIGIEYQGIQHFKAIKHWGGKDALEKLKERDIKKKGICNDKNINLVYFDYNEGLSDEFVLAKIKPLIIKL